MIKVEFTKEQAEAFVWYLIYSYQTAVFYGEYNKAHFARKVMESREGDTFPFPSRQSILDHGGYVRQYADKQSPERQEVLAEVERVLREHE